MHNTPCLRVQLRTASSSSSWWLHLQADRHNRMLNYDRSTCLPSQCPQIWSGLLPSSILVGEVPVLGCLEVPEYSVKHALMFFSGVHSMPTKCSDSICEVQTSALHGIHNGAKGTLVWLDISFIRKNQLFLLHLITSYSSYFEGKKGISGNKTSFFLLMTSGDVSLVRCSLVSVMLCMDSEEWYACLLTDWRLTIWIWECGKVVSHSGTPAYDGLAHLRPLAEGYKYSGQGSVLILMTCLLGKYDTSWHWWH